MNHIAKWNGSQWAALGAGVSGTDYVRVNALLGVPPTVTEPPTLLVGGSFPASPAGDSYLAAWRGCRHNGDLNGDGVVNIDDLLAVIAGWGPCPTPPAACPPDIVPDGIVNIDDLLLVIANWG